MRETTCGSEGGSVETAEAKAAAVKASEAQLDSANAGLQRKPRSSRHRLARVKHEPGWWSHRTTWRKPRQRRHRQRGSR